MFRYGAIVILQGFLLFMTGIVAAQEDPLPPIPANFTDLRLIVPNELLADTFPKDADESQFMLFSPNETELSIEMTRLEGVFVPTIALFDAFEIPVAQETSTDLAGRVVQLDVTLDPGWYILVAQATDRIATDQDAIYQLQLFGGDSQVYRFVGLPLPPDDDTPVVLDQNWRVDPRMTTEAWIPALSRDTLIIPDDDELLVTIEDIEGNIEDRVTVGEPYTLNEQSDDPIWLRVRIENLTDAIVIQRVSERPEPAIAQLITLTPTNTATATVTATRTPTATATPTNTFTPTHTLTPTDTLTPTATFTPSQTPLPSATFTATPTATATATSTATNSPTITPLPSPTLLPTRALSDVRGRVTTRALNVRSGPGTQYTEVLELFQGTEVYVNALSSNRQWLRLEGRNETVDLWVSVGLLTIVEGRTGGLPIADVGAADIGGTRFKDVRIVCPGAAGPSFEVGDEFIVPVGDGATGLYAQPNSVPAQGQILEGNGGIIVDGPTCVMGRNGLLLAWYITTDRGNSGWVSEGYPNSPVPWIAPR